MSILGTLAKLAAIAGAVERAGNAIGAAVKSLRRMKRPKALARAAAERAQPMTHELVDDVERQIDQATSHGLVQGGSPRAVTRDPRTTILPPRR